MNWAASYTFSLFLQGMGNEEDDGKEENGGKKGNI